MIRCLIDQQAPEWEVLLLEPGTSRFQRAGKARSCAGEMGREGCVVIVRSRA